MSTLLDGVDEGWVRPHVDREFAFDDAREAHAYIEDRRSTGKVVLTT
jgi:NADPH:quinone reductase-like Zn-dependent oxidoreductase